MMHIHTTVEGLCPGGGSTFIFWIHADRINMIKVMGMASIIDGEIVPATEPNTDTYFLVADIDSELYQSVNRIIDALDLHDHINIINLHFGTMFLTDGEKIATIHSITDAEKFERDLANKKDNKFPEFKTYISIGEWRQVPKNVTDAIEAWITPD
jgi:hypothetical protein